MRILPIVQLYLARYSYHGYIRSYMVGRSKIERIQYIRTFVCLKWVHLFISDYIAAVGTSGDRLSYPIDNLCLNVNKYLLVNCKSTKKFGQIGPSGSKNSALHINELKPINAEIVVEFCCRYEIVE